MEMIKKVFTTKQIDAQNFTVEAYASTKAVDRDGEVILPTAWDLSEYNGIVVDSHNYESVEQAIGKVVESVIDENGLKVKIQYFVGQGNDTADWAWVLVQNGLASYSVGFIPVESIPGQGDIKRIYTKVKLLEISQVLVPANPYAVQDDITYAPLIKSFKELKEVMSMEIKGVISYHDYGIVEDESTPWDGNAEVREADVETLKKICAWYDDSNPDVKSSYKLPHHRASDLKAVWRGVAAAMAALLGARGGVNIPEKDKQGVYEHLAKHYKQFGKEPPEMKHYASEDEILKACKLEEPVIKYGRVLSEANRQRIQKTVDTLDALIKQLRETKKDLEDLLSLEDTASNTASLEVEETEIKHILETLKKIL
jgi:phage head maturation protease